MIAGIYQLTDLEKCPFAVVILFMLNITQKVH